MGKLCALVIGHKKESYGARNENKNLTEFDFNDDLARRIERKVREANIQRVYRQDTYAEIPNQLNELDPDFIVSLHCNACNKIASGTEVLYYHSSQKAKQMAEVLQDYLVSYLGLPDRGIKPTNAKDRGGNLLCHTNAPCVIAEPFFIDNDNDLQRALEDIEGLAQTYARAIDEISKEVI